MEPVVVGLYDVAPATFDACRRWLELLDERSIPVTLFLISGPWGGNRLRPDERTVPWLHEAVGRGHEVAAHGWMHHSPSKIDPRVARQTAGGDRDVAEFLGIHSAEAEGRIERMIGEFGACDLYPVGFAPPGGVMSAYVRGILADRGFRYVASSTDVIDLELGICEPVPITRVGAAGTVTLGSVPRRGLIRFALTPADLESVARRRAVVRALDMHADNPGGWSTYAHLFAERRLTSSRIDRQPDRFPKRSWHGGTRVIRP